MLFNSYVFLLAFLPLALIGFGAACRAGVKPGALWLVAASLVFYGWWNPAFVPLLIVSIAGNYTVSVLIQRFANRPLLRDGLLTAGIGANLAALFYCKYLGAILNFAHVLFNAPALPLGISFFTFTQIGYLLDCRSLSTERSLLRYALFVTFFPHLIAGPLLHHREVLPQFTTTGTWLINSRNVAVGSAIFLTGLLKKTLLADPLAAVVGAGFADPESLTLLPAWQAALSYSLQLYFDFSGYSDMAIGLARMFNIRFPLNFNSPYKAESVIDYWQRWHMTLTRWLTLYLYNPMALSIAR
ncbi:MAG: MBOAT family protein, partial [Acetobacteraceae bacterium]|nr:MBOAT family protein [Acetobacteraceae bacterium]